MSNSINPEIFRRFEEIKADAMKADESEIPSDEYLDGIEADEPTRAVVEAARRIRWLVERVDSLIDLITRKDAEIGRLKGRNATLLVEKSKLAKVHQAALNWADADFAPEGAEVFREIVRANRREP